MLTMSEQLGQKKSGGHGNHWDVVIGKVNRDLMFEKLISGVCVNSKPVKTVKFNGYLKGDFSIFEKNFNELVSKVVTLNGFFPDLKTANNALITAFPRINSSNFQNCKITGVEEWQNEIEAQVKAKFSDVSLNFFALDYLENREKYAVNESVEIALTGLAVNLKKGSLAGKPLKDGRTFADDFTSVFPAKDVFPTVSFDIDDYYVYGLVEDLKKAKFGEENGYIMKTKMVGTNDWKVVADIGVFERDIVGEIPKKGDTITTTIWLSGRLKSKSLFGF